MALKIYPKRLMPLRLKYGLLESGWLRGFAVMKKVQYWLAAVLLIMAPLSFAVNGGLTLIEQPAVAAKGYTGGSSDANRVPTVVILDEGFINPEKVPNANVIAFYDCAQYTATQGCKKKTKKTKLSPYKKHAAAMAGIISAVAPDTRIIAMDIFNKAVPSLAINSKGNVAVAPLASLSVEAARNAFKWIEANRDEYNIVAVSISLGSANIHPNGCTGKGSFQSEFQSLRSKGIIPVVASGNSAYQGGFGAPFACLQEAVTVGAVYAENYPSQTFEHKQGNPAEMIFGGGGGAGGIDMNIPKRWKDRGKKAPVKNGEVLNLVFPTQDIDFDSIGNWKGAILNAEFTTTNAECKDVNPKKDQIACLTTRGPGLDLYAPGGVINGFPNYVKEAKGSNGVGTSFAAPFVAGSIAVLRGAMNKTAAEIEGAGGNVERALVDNVIDALKEGGDSIQDANGVKRLNLNKSLKYILKNPSQVKNDAVKKKESTASVVAHDNVDVQESVAVQEDKSVQETKKRTFSFWDFFRF